LSLPRLDRLCFDDDESFKTFYLNSKLAKIHLEGTKLVLHGPNYDPNSMGLIINDKRRVMWNPEDIVFKNTKAAFANPLTAKVLKQFIIKIAKLTPQQKVSIEMYQFSDTEMNDLRA
jgi:hypothetical protein